MPSEHKSPIDQHQQDQLQGQDKECPTCHAPLLEPATSLFMASVVCLGCRERTVPSLVSTPDVRPHRFDIGTSYPVRQLPHELPIAQSTRRYQDIVPADFDSVVSSFSASSVLESSVSYNGSSPPSPIYSQKSLNFQYNTIPHSTLLRRQNLNSFVPQPYESTRQQSTSHSSPDPLTDITRIRIRSRGHHCLYPGAAFQGTQKSGRNSYDVNVTIVDVNFTSSTLCGYLRIKGLTDDWPELTTYFDAEIIGSRYGFLTQNWGATQHEDMVHWSRFPAFKHIKHEAKRPHMTIDGQDRGAIFMRWKERFLVPDHRVQDINGASFAGFYYVCVDFNPQASILSTTPSPRSASQPTSSAPTSEAGTQSSQPVNSKTEGRQRSRRDSSIRRRDASPTPLSAPVATMSGFYYHQNSEPYQQLSLTHLPERTSSSFEFR